MADERLNEDQWVANARQMIGRAKAAGQLTPSGESRLMARINNVRQAAAAGNQELVNYNKVQFGKEADEEASAAAQQSAEQPAEQPVSGGTQPAEEETEEEGKKEQRRGEEPRPREKKPEKKTKENKPEEKNQPPKPKPEGEGPTPPGPKPVSPSGIVAAGEGAAVPGEVAAGETAGGAAAGGTAAAGAAAGEVAAGATAATGEAAAVGTTAATVGGGGAVAGGGAVVVGGTVVEGGAVVTTVAAPEVVLIVIVVLLVILIVVAVILKLFLAFSEKSVDLAGGSVQTPMYYSHNIELQKEVQQYVDDGKLVFADPQSAQDIKWQDNAEAPEGKALNSDWRVMATMEYLVRKWGYIRVGLSYSNGPTLTQRYPMTVTAAIRAMVDKMTGHPADNQEPYETNSAYHTGQAIGIDQIGVVSKALGNACFGGVQPPVEVAWQEVTREDILRNWYEQMQVDATDLYKVALNLEVIGQQAQVDQNNADIAAQDMTKSGSDYVAADRVIANLLIIIERAKDLGRATDLRTTDYLNRAKTNLVRVQTALQGVEGADRVKLWGDKEKVQQPIHDGLQIVFRAMQVANMVNWRGDTSQNCRLWKAYEARQNIRQLALDMMRIPLDTKYLEKDQKYNSDLVVKQLIVYSPEDDLDNGLPDLDVFPNGAVAVDEGGVGYDDSARDGGIDVKDNHFMSLPVDNGVFSKAETIFVFKEDNAWKQFKDVVGSTLSYANPITAIAKTREKINELISGDWLGVLSGDKIQRVTYKNFVHIGF